MRNITSVERSVVMSQRITFVLSELTSQGIGQTIPANRRPCAISKESMGTTLGKPLTQASLHHAEEGHSGGDRVQQQHAISIVDPPALPQRRACLGSCIVVVGIIWCIATIGMAIAFVATGRSVIESRVARLAPIARSSDFVKDVPRRACDLKLRITYGEATLLEVGAALALSIGHSVNVDEETSIFSYGRRLITVRFANCDPVLELTLGGEALQQSWSSNLCRMRGARLVITDGPEVVAEEEAGTKDAEKQSASHKPSFLKINHSSFPRPPNSGEGHTTTMSRRP